MPLQTVRERKKLAKNLEKGVKLCIFAAWKVNLIKGNGLDIVQLTLPIIMNGKTLISLFFSSILCVNLHAQNVPNAANFLPSPPTYNSAKFKNDSAQYEWGKLQRSTALGEQAKSDMSWELNAYLSTFSSVIGIDITVSKTPNIYELCNYGMVYARRAIEQSQASRFSWRPFVRYNEESLISNLDAQYRTTSSYPSAQATYGWLMGMLLAEVCPDKQDAILKRAYAIGTSSVIAGYNWQSDTENGRDLASAVSANIHSHNGFLTLVRLAQKEMGNQKSVLPDPTKYLPDPPAEGSSQYAYDVAAHEDGKALRQTERGKQAASDANDEVEDMAELFSPLFGRTISPGNTPELYKLMDSLFPLIDDINYDTKVYYGRLRPYVMFNENTGYPEDEEKLRKSYSYPSGHSLLGWLVGLILSEVNPSRLETIMQRAYEFGQSRVILGYHWQSDVIVGRVVAGSAFSYLHSDSNYLSQLESAIREFKGGSSGIQTIQVSDKEENAPIYNLNGIRLNSKPTRRGVYIRGHKKYVY